ncbi:MAG: hypothetical protein LBB34_01075 [Holosporales bacterium]|jgi:predicted nucleotide-binding protein (sugar kinase/HSP70/actin superfamily)|nr:hypothetical protein [Holosporales bacterium]
MVCKNPLTINVEVTKSLTVTEKDLSVSVLISGTAAFAGLKTLNQRTELILGKGARLACVDDSGKPVIAMLGRPYRMGLPKCIRR